MKIVINNLEDISRAAQDFLPLLKEHPVEAFYGGLGAGKTTFIKALCDQLQVTDSVTSPSFAIVNEYHSALTGRPVYHFDFYRIKKLEEVYDIGYDDYVYSGYPCLIEWPEMIETLLPDDYLHVRIEVKPDESRELHIQ